MGQNCFYVNIDLMNPGFYRLLKTSLYIHVHVNTEMTAVSSGLG